ncbi:MAG: hypothetical protein ACKVP5_20330 [Aestuariivirga sp.]
MERLKRWPRSSNRVSDVNGNLAAQIQRASPEHHRGSSKIVLQQRNAEEEM